MNRRDAVRTLASVATVPLFDRLSAIQSDKLDHLGLAIITVRPLIARDVARTFKQVADIGYRDVDMYIYESRLMPKETRALLDQAGLTCRSARVATPAIYRGWDRSLDAAATLGARWITLANVPWEERLIAKDWQEMADVFNRIGDAARQRGLRFVYHNHDVELQPIQGIVPLDFLVASTDADLVRLQMDVYWMTKGGRNPATEIARLGRRIASLHLKDMDRTPEGGITTVGAGTIDFRPILAAAQRAGITDLYVEEDAPKDPLAAARASYTYLTSLEF
jgi:sugar phosphate isomerase/epimerase